MRRSSILYCILLALVSLPTVGCSPRYKHDVDTMLQLGSGARRVPTPIDYALRRWTVGQWVLSKTNSPHSGISIDLIGVVAEDECGTWIVRVHTDYHQRTLSKICFRVASAREDMRTLVDSIQVAIAQVDDRPATTLDFREGRNAPLKQGLKHALGADFQFLDWKGSHEDVIVPAGTFSQAVRVPFPNGTVWFHPGAPISGILRVLYLDGTEVVLIDYAEQGAHQMISTGA